MFYTPISMPFYNTFIYNVELAPLFIGIFVQDNKSRTGSKDTQVKVKNIHLGVDLKK